MFKTVAGLTSVIAIMAVIGGANAQSSESNSASGSSSQSNSGSSSFSSSKGGAGGTSNANLKSTTNTGVTVDQRSYGGGQSGLSYSGGTNNSSYNRNDGDVTVRTTPTVYAPPVSGGNPCTLAVSGGVSVIGWGAAAGGTFVDQDCANRQKIAMMHNAGYAQAARELMCNDKDTYFAFRTAGQPCAYRAAFEGNMAPPAAAQPIPVSAPVPVTAPPPPVVAGPKQYQRCNPRAGIVDNCISG